MISDKRGGEEERGKKSSIRRKITDYLSKKVRVNVKVIIRAKQTLYSPGQALRATGI